MQTVSEDYFLSNKLFSMLAFGASLHSGTYFVIIETGDRNGVWACWQKMGVKKSLFLIKKAELEKHFASTIFL